MVKWHMCRAIAGGDVHTWWWWWCREEVSECAIGVGSGAFLRESGKFSSSYKAVEADNRYVT